MTTGGTVTDDDVTVGQRALLDAMYRRHVRAGDSYALVDFPDHANVGDSAIWLGEIAMLRSVTGRDPDYMSTWDNFDAEAFRCACPDGVLFLHGGGNLGDIWPHHQRFREMLLATMRDRPIVQLPQSIHFRAAAGMADFAALVAAHPDFHLHVRDRASLDLARTHMSCPVDLTPDSAFALGRQARGAADRDVLMLLRTDDEQAGHVWGDLDGVADALRVDWLMDDALPPVMADQSRADDYAALAAARVTRGLGLLSRGRRIVTDRLHGHILAMLLDIPHVALDNDYGKISGYIDTWTSGSARVRVATTASGAATLLADGAG